MLGVSWEATTNHSRVRNTADWCTSEHATVHRRLIRTIVSIFFIRYTNIFLTNKNITKVLGACEHPQAVSNSGRSSIAPARMQQTLKLCKLRNDFCEYAN